MKRGLSTGIRTALACSFVIFGAAATAAQQAPLAPTPPMGWNSWDVYGATVTESEVKANVDVFAAKLRPLGWKYAVVDIEWYTPRTKLHGDEYIPDPSNVTMDGYGRFIPAPNRFPSASKGNGFRPLADYVHAKGLKFGIHIMRGIPRAAVERDLPIEGTAFHAADIADKTNICHWANMQDTYGVDMSKPGAQAYYDSIARLYASWGVDYVKADDMTFPFHGAEIEALSSALRKTGRPIVLSLSPGPAPLEKHSQLKAAAQMWRISGDLWDRWGDVKRQFDLAHQWEPYVGDGNWPDADMLPLGRIAIRGGNGLDRASRLTDDEQRTLMTLWSIFRSPLMFGGSLPDATPFTLSLLTNPEIIAVDQRSTQGHQIYRVDNLVAWTAAIPGRQGSYLALSNLADEPKAVDLPLSTFGLQPGTANARDLWQRKDVGVLGRVKVVLNPHASILYRLSRVAGAAQISSTSQQTTVVTYSEPSGLVVFQLGV